GPVDLVRKPEEETPGKAVQGNLVHPIQGDVEQPGQLAFDDEVATCQVAHQIADAAVVAEGNQGTMVTVTEGHRLQPLEATAQGLGQGLGLLVSGLGPWRHGTV